MKWLKEVYASCDAIRGQSLFKYFKRKYGRRDGMRARLQSRGSRTPLLAVTFGNVRSIRKKIDDLTVNCKYLREHRKSAIIALTETWLQDRDAGGTVSIDGFTLIRSDRRNTDKERGGGIAAHTNDRWRTQATVHESHCSKDIEL